MRPLLFLFTLIFIFSLTSCQDDEMTGEPVEPSGDLVNIPHDPTPYNLVIPEGFPAMSIPADNPMTEEGFALGRRLFYDVRLSADNSMSCASCHLPELGFTDGTAFSTGIHGEMTSRSSMSLVNIGFQDFGIFWDGRSESLEAQALLPVEDAIELSHSWDNVEQMLQTDEQYREMFRRAFDIDDSSEIKRDLAVKAIAQFERALISSNSKYDKFILQRNFAYEFTDSEIRGLSMYIDDGAAEGLPDAECDHCHDLPLSTLGQFFNNGLDSYPTLADYEDKGLGAVTGNVFNNGQFKAPTLRNIALTAPYMHDGRFATLEEVIDHYNEGVHFAENLDGNLDGSHLNLTEENKVDLINFLKTLTDPEFLVDERFQSPF